MSEEKETEQQLYMFSQIEMDMVRLGLENIKDRCQSPDTAWTVPGEVDTLVKILFGEKNDG